MANRLSDTSAYLRAVRVKAANKQIFRALLSLASAALLVRVMGMLNQVVVTSRFGAGPGMDAYFISSALPLLLASLLGSALEVSIIPTYTRVRTRGTKEEASRLFSTLLNLFILTTIVVTLVLLLLRAPLIYLSAPGSPSSTLALAINLAPFIFPAFVLMVMVSYLECILNAEGQFGWPAYAGMLVPLTTALLVLTAGRSLGIVMLCVGMVAGLSLQLGAFVIRARRAGLVYHLVLDLRHPAIGPIIKVGGPVLIGSLIGQATNLTDQIFASFLPPGSISALNYALKLTSVFIGVIFVSVGRAILPYLSRQASMRDIKAFKQTLRLYIWLVGIGTTMLSILLVVLAHPLVQLLFQRGAFTADDTNHTANTFIGFAVGLTPIAFGFIASRAVSALGKAGVLLPVTICSLSANALFDYIFSRIWQSEGIALSTSVAYVCTMFIFFFILRRTIGELHIATPPQELVGFLRKAGSYVGLSEQAGQARGTLATHSPPLRAGNNGSSFSIPYRMRMQITRFGLIIAVFATGVVGFFLNSLNALRISWASIVMVALLRYNFVLLLGWILINGPNAMPFFRGTNVLIGLTVPTLLLIPSLPIKQTIKRLPALSVLFLYLLWASASLTISPLGLGPALTAWVLELDCLAVSILAINVLNTRRRLLICVDTLLLLSTSIALYGIYGYITKHNGLVDPTTSLYRIVSIFAAAPGLAFFLSLVIPLALYRTVTLQGFKRIVAALSAIILLVAAALTFTRAAYICIPLSIIIMAFYVPSRRMRNMLLSSIMAVALILVLLATIGNLPILGRFTSQDVATLNGRTYLWQAILAHFDAGQLLGNGILASDALLTVLHIGAYGQGVIGTSPHALFLGTLYDHGIIGTLLLFLVFLALFSNLIAGIRKASGEHRTLYAVALAVLVNIFVQSFDSNEFWDPALDIYIWIVIILPFALCWSKQEQQTEPADEDSVDDPTEPRLRAVQPVERGQVSVA